MDRDIVQSSEGITLVGAGHPNHGDIKESLKSAPYLVAADGGANYCVDAGFVPSAVIGDLDSLDTNLGDDLSESKLIRVDEQETTDFEKCLTRIDAPFILATGFTDGRIDHTLAVWSVLARRIGPPTLVLGRNDVVFATGSALHITLPLGSRLSLFPLFPMMGRSEGLEWPIDGLTLSPTGRIGTSNRVTGPVRLEFDAPGCLVITPREALAPALAALTGLAPVRGR